MQLNSDPLSSGAALEALRRAHEDLSFVYSFCPDMNEDALDSALHSIARVRRRIFESSLRICEDSSMTRLQNGGVRAGA